MPLVAAIPAVVSAGAAIYSSSQQKKAANNAQQAQEATSQQQLQLQREQFDRVEGLNRRFIEGGYAGFDALLSRLGVQPGAAGQPQVRPANAPAATPQASADWQAYLDSNPDVAANAAARAQAEGVDPLVIAEEHYRLYGKDENRALPMAPSQQFTDPNAPPDYMNMARPDAPQAPEFTRPEAVQFRDYGDGPQFSWDPSQIAKDPGFQFETGEAAKGVNANFAARSRLRSGGAAKALQDRLFGVAHTYGNDYFSRALSGYNANRGAFESNRNFGTNLTRYQQDRGDNIFADDRAFDMAKYQDARGYGDFRFDTERDYRTRREDAATDNLFRLTGVGVGAAGAVSGAGGAFANNASNIFQNNATAQADAAAARASANSQLAGSLGGTAANLFANWGGGVRTPTVAPNAGKWTGQMGNWGF